MFIISVYVISGYAVSRGAFSLVVVLFTFPRCSNPINVSLPSLGRPQWSFSSRFAAYGCNAAGGGGCCSRSFPARSIDNLIDMEIPPKEVCIAMLPLRRSLSCLRHPLLGHLLCPWKIHNFASLLPNSSPLHTRHCGKYFNPNVTKITITRCLLVCGGPRKKFSLMPETILLSGFGKKLPPKGSLCGANLQEIQLAMQL